MQLTQHQREELKHLVLPLLDDLERFALSLCRREDVAEELVAATIASACESFGRLRDTTRVKQWLFRILSNKFLSDCRKQSRHKEIALTDSLDDGIQQFSLFEAVSQPFLLWWGNPERELISRIVDEDIRNALDSLPVDFRVAVVLCDVEGQTYEEIAEILKIKLGTVRSRIARGRSLLQKKLWHHAQDLGLVKTKEARQ
ncbi:MAG TPA: sigma-70 family RNA polymerase sigma factor [Bacteroidota bacterium]|nr:sigma-70 family RNA polymerase sigma factor [Bacteroidota bacterium]